VGLAAFCSIAVLGTTAAQVDKRVSKALTVDEERFFLQPKDSFRECDVCPEMVVVPAGEFIMGSPEGEPGRRNWEGPQHKVRITRKFAVGKFEVSFAEWDACVAAGGCGYTPSDEGWGRGRLPVINVSWEKITQQYLPWLSRRTGHKPYRLLSEAEWEYVARAGTKTPFWWGSSISRRQANFERMDMRTVPVDSFAPNPWGLYNVHGNVWEWVQDCHNENYLGAPADGTAWTTGTCGSRMVRGGAAFYIGDMLRSAARLRWSTYYSTASFGFRVARTLRP
jgi:formylglycine-generating enzyme required for sulfatase activity